MASDYWKKMNEKVRDLALNKDKFSLAEQDRIRTMVDNKKYFGRVSPNHIKVLNELHKKLTEETGE